MKELVEGLGFNCHLINTDSWSKQNLEEPEYENIFKNYELNSLNKFIKSVLDENFPIYHNHFIKLSTHIQMSDFCEVLYLILLLL